MYFLKMNLVSIKKLTFVWMNAIPIFLIFLYFYVEKYFNDYKVNSSSVWCRKSLTGSKLCTFQNICYNPKFASFLFFLSEFSVLRGLSHYNELQTIQLSSIYLHNKFEANISIVNSAYYPAESVKKIKNGLLFSRFKSDNIMHVIHDDLMPVFWTLQEICLGDMIYCNKNYHLLLHDNYQKGPYFDLYKSFTSVEPVLLHLLSNVLCFDVLHMGILQDTIFYQYGFNQVQGPVENLKITSNDISQFASFITKKLDVKTEYSKTDKTDIVLISRKRSRRILNEESLIRMLESSCKKQNSSQACTVVTLDLFENKTNVVIKAIRKASMLVGMHGAEMIFSIFLKENSTVVELFPFGIQPDVVSFVKVLSEIKGIHFSYINWENKFKNHSVFHPDADSLHGGINHLPKRLKDKIIITEKVPAVKCCNDPMYLYHMYQDTFIDSSFQSFLISELMKTKSALRSFQVYDTWFFPSVVGNVTCRYDYIVGYLNMSWTKPFNVKNEALVYDILVLDQSNVEFNIVTGNTTLRVNVAKGSNDLKFQVWISAVIKSTNARSKDIYLKCT